MYGAELFTAAALPSNAGDDELGRADKGGVGVPGKTELDGTWSVEDILCILAAHTLNFLKEAKTAILEMRLGSGP